MSRQEPEHGLTTISEVDKGPRKSSLKKLHKHHLSVMVSEKLAAVFSSKTPDKVFSSFREPAEKSDGLLCSVIARLSEIGNKHESSLRPFEHNVLISKIDGHKYYLSGIVDAIKSKNQQARSQATLTALSWEDVCRKVFSSLVIGSLLLWEEFLYSRNQRSARTSSEDY